MVVERWKIGACQIYAKIHYNLLDLPRMGTKRYLRNNSKVTFFFSLERIPKILCVGSMGWIGSSQTSRRVGLKKIFLFSKSLAAKSIWRLISSPSLWREVVIHKYISWDSILDYIRKHVKNLNNVSKVWKIAVKDFDLIITSYEKWGMVNIVHWAWILDYESNKIISLQVASLSI